MELKAPKPIAELVLASATRDSTPPYEEWQSFSGVVTEGHFFADDLAEVRQRLHKEVYTARVSLTHKCEARKLTYAPPKGKMVIHTEQNDAPEIAAFLRHFSLPYHGSALPAAVGQVMELLLNPKREAFLQRRRHVQYQEQGGRCALSDAELRTGEDEGDHPQALHSCIAG